MRTIIRVVLALVLTLSIAAPVAADLAPTGNNISPIILLDRSTNELFVFGTVACTTEETASVTAVVTQGDVTRIETIEVACSPTPTFFVIRLPNDGTGRFRPGPTDLEFGFSAGTTVFGRFVPGFIVGF
jgi:hypothetical protein